MLKYLAKLIQKQPWLVISIILIITMGFSTLLPSLEMKTDMKDFMPDDELVKANMRIMDYFGGSQQIMFLYIERQQAESVITPDALRELYYVQKNLDSVNGINGSVSIVTLIEPVCWMEYGRSFENCTNGQIIDAIKDILFEQKTNVSILASDDSNEAIDYVRYPRISKGRSADALDVKNGYIFYNDTDILFTIQVYDLSSFKSGIKPPLPFINAVEWYIGFNNLIMPLSDFNVRYEIAARVEPKYSLWEIGKKTIPNLKSLYDLIRSRDLFDSYKASAYLWMELPKQNISYPMPLHNANVTFDISTNSISIKVPREELGRFGIAPQLDSFALPAKLGNFTVGTRCYATPILKLPWNRIEVNTSFLIKTIESMQNKTMMSKVSDYLIKHFLHINFESYEMPSNFSIPLPDTVSMMDIKARWNGIDISNEKSSSTLFIRPFFFKDLKTNILGFLSKDYNINKKPGATIIIIQLDNIDDYEENIALNQRIISYVEKLDSTYPYVSFKATGDGIISAQIHEVTSEANRIIGPSIFFIIMFILFVSFRRFSYIVLPLFSLTVSVIWVFGTMVLLGMPFNAMAVAVVPLLMGLGVDYSVHLSHTYRSELEKGKKPGEAITIAIQEIGRAMFLAMLTTVIAFLSFLTATIPPVRNFGIILALGILYTFINAITLQASIRYILDRKRIMKINKKKKNSLRSSMEKLSKIIMKHQKTVLTAMILVSLIMGFGALQTKTGFDYKSFLPENNPAMEVFNKIANNFPYASQDQEYILIEGDVATVKTLQGIKKTMENLDDDTFVARKADGTVKAVNIYTLIQQASSANRTLIKEYNLDENTGIPKTDNDVKKLYDYLYNSDQYKMQTKALLYKENNKYKATNIRIYIDPSISLDGNADLNKNIKILKNELNQDMEDYGDAKAIATGSLLITYSITNSLTQSQIISTILSFLIAVIVLAIAYKNPLLGLITVIPVGISVIWILGTIHFIGYTLNVLTITVTSLTIGMGIDYAIHATERFRLIADRTGSVNEAVLETISHTGGALLISAVTTAAGFGVLILAPMPPEVQFGVITSITITYAFITSIMLLPLVLDRWGRWRKRKKGYVISHKKVKED
ncbi:MAG TPA: hypothetical protein ENI49_02585 [Thermoplasmatales archaeon]|nr:hypothetical protein [Thermoplasmatales archaeon]